MDSCTTMTTIYGTRIHRAVGICGWDMGLMDQHWYILWDLWLMMILAIFYYGISRIYRTNEVKISKNPYGKPLWPMDSQNTQRDSTHLIMAILRIPMTGRQFFVATIHWLIDLIAHGSLISICTRRWVNKQTPITMANVTSYLRSTHIQKYLIVISLS